jgi:hypothetical protein
MTTAATPSKIGLANRCDAPPISFQSITEMCRVAKEVRIFPLLDTGRKKPDHLHRVISELENKGNLTTLVKTSYEFQKGADAFLRVVNPKAQGAATDLPSLGPRE